ncbi:MAG: Glu/Leu/Phe/Val dehydrogenase dimerization domain-containing protein, partial [Patescibacteria group bacterium]
FEHESIYFRTDKASGLKAIIAIHSTRLGPALGGCRMRPYASAEEALEDALRLSRGMTFKAAAADLPLGGGKAVIIGDPARDKTPALLHAFGRMVQELGGRYITAEDVGTTVADMEHIRAEAPLYVVGIAEADGASGDPSPVTATGVLHAIDACLDFTTGKTSLAGKRIAIQGVGKVGMSLAELLFSRGADLVVCDVVPERARIAAKRFLAEVASPEEIFGVPADIFCPCSLGGALNDETIPQIRAPIVCGAANNQLLDEERHGWMLMERGIVYVPDYVANAGGLISVYREIEKSSVSDRLTQLRVIGIGRTVRTVLEMARAEGIPTHQAAHRLVSERLEKGIDIS